ncbi:MAG: hypothetical protein FWC86_06235 [Coriobacteriia bacterium]|nr:hypothetical protein [Coriobacteriia bacterium]
MSEKNIDMESVQNIAFNNFCSLAIHAALVVLCLLLGVLVTLFDFALADAGIELSTTFISVFVVLGLIAVQGLYALCAYRFFRPVFKCSLFSVTILPAILISIFTVLSWSAIDLNSPYESTAHAVSTLMNTSSVYMVMMVHSFLMTPGYYNQELLPSYLMYVAALLPSLLMYTGLRIKMRAEKGSID